MQQDFDQQVSSLEQEACNAEARAHEKGMRRAEIIIKVCCETSHCSIKLTNPASHLPASHPTPSPSLSPLPPTSPHAALGG
jgi:hypothetical protein